MNENDFRKELWKQAQEIAKEDYETNWGGSWDEADKYEREDFAFDAYEKLGGFELDKKIAKLDELRAELKEVRGQSNILTTGQWFDKIIAINKQMYPLEKEIEDMMQRDSKGRFISNKGNNETTNKNLNERGNDTMERKNNAEVRMNKLAEAGVDTNNFFNINLQVPFGKEVRILVDGKEMVVPTKPIVPQPTRGFVLGSRKVEMCNGDLIDSITGEVVMMGVDKDAEIDPIAQSIIEDGYVKNSKLFRRWITAHTFKMLNYESWRNPNRKGWEACFKDRYAYEYQFEMLKDELHTLAKLQKEDPEYFAERTMFFNGDVVVATLNDYLYRLKKYVKKQMKENPRKYRGEQYVKLAKYGNVLVKDLDMTYLHINNRINRVKSEVETGNYERIEKEFNNFMNNAYNKLPYETPKCAVFKDAFKGAGAYYSLQNMIRFHNVILRGCTNKYDSEGMLKSLLYDEYKNEVWRFHQLLVDTIAYNNFDLKKSIANGNAAPGTKSDKADYYKRNNK